MENTDGFIEEGKSKAKKTRAIRLRGLGMPPVSRTAGGWPAVSGAVLEAAVSAVGGKVNNKDALMAALKKTNVPTARGYVKFDDLGNVVGDVYIRQVARKEGRLVNSVIKTYSNISQYWTYDPKQFLANPVYSRDWPPAKNIES